MTLRGLYELIWGFNDFYLNKLLDFILNHDLGEIKFKNGNTFIGQFKGGKREGAGEMSYTVAPESNPRDMGNYKGEWKRDKRDGNGVMKYYNG
jgi:hypothetical protein